MNVQLKRVIDDANTYLQDIFKDTSKFEFIEESENSYQFKLTIGVSEENILVLKEHINSGWWMDSFFDWVRSCLISNWKHRNLGWS